MPLVTLLRIEIDLFSLAILAIIGASVIIRNRYHRFMDSRLFLLLIISISSVIIFEGLSWIVDGKPGAAMRIAGYVINILFYALIFTPMGIYLIYVDHFTAPNRPLVLSIYFWTAIAVAVMGALFAVLSPIRGLLFHLDGKNIYSRGPLNGFFNILMAVIGLLPAYVLVRRRKTIPSASFFNLILYPIMPSIGGILQQFVYGTNLFWPATVIAVFITFINVQNRQIDSDYLTGTFNRSSLQEYMGAMVRKTNEKRTFAGIMLDLDNFKLINDKCGHRAGDQALIEMAGILHASVRKTDFVARYGGDEFIVILDTGSDIVVNEIIDRIHAAMKAANSAEKDYTLSASIGRAIFSLESDRNLDTFIHRLDGLMYMEKARLVSTI
ncbi:MAG TPA: GGDEF domain-containing protein [Rectinemataceae bacterium]|nr:GGDEF domain-containing protein [Rectinemataceae bacterium]